MYKRFLRILAAAGATVIGFSTLAFPLTALAAGGFQTIKGSNMVEYHGSYDADNFPYERLNAEFTTSPITVDGILEDAYNVSAASRIDNAKAADDKGYGEEQQQTYGELRALWDGPVLYLGISVNDGCVLTSTETTKGGVGNPAVAGVSETTYISYGGYSFPTTTTRETCDSVAIAVDLFNDRTDYEIDTAGVIVIDALGQLYYYSSSNIPSLGSALGDPNHPEYMNIIKDYAAAPKYDEAGNQIGYNVEIALQIEDLKPNNGTEVGIDIKINDVNDIVTGYTKEQRPNPDYVPPTTPDPGQTDPGQTDPGQTDPGQTDPGQTDPGQTDPGQTDPGQTDPGQTDPGQTDPGQTDPGQTDPGQADPGQTDPSQPDPGQTDPGQTDPGQTDPGQTDPGQTNPSQTNPGQTDPSQTDPGQTDPSQTDPTTPDPATQPGTPTVPEYIEVDVPTYERGIKSSNIFWSHSQDSLYTDFDHEHTKSLDWGVVTLAGWNGTDAFAYSEWRIKKILDYMNSASFPTGVYTAGSQATLDAAKANAEAIMANSAKDKATTDQAATELENAFYGLKWADTRYPDPSDLPKQITLPNTYKFFGSDRVVKTKEEWEERSEEILKLAQFYEYGFKPDYDSMTVTNAEAHKVGDTKYRWSNSQKKWVTNGTYSSPSVSITANVTVGTKNKDITFEVSMPTDDKIIASGHEGEKLPIVLSFDGSIASYTNAGIAMIAMPSVVNDTRTNSYAWGARTGTFYDLYPYSRNGEAALNEVSNEMASAWSASVVIDALEACAVSEDENIKNAVSDLAIDKLAVTGFSINGKYAFVSAVFDDRIDVCIPGAAGATGPSPWRYVYRGQIYDWDGTRYTNPQVDSYQVAWGTEVMANSIRHNRVRETELFRHFLTPGHFYAFEDGAYGYGLRLPYDQNDLIATLATKGRAIVIENTVNDYNDGCTADCLGAEVAKSVYRNLGYDADKLVKFNLRGLKTDDPHGSDTEQRNRSAAYLNYYFFGTEMDADTADYLNTDPYSLNISNNKTENPYNYYWGGFNTVTGGTGGAAGRDGWYYYTFPTSSTPTPQGGQGAPASGSGSSEQTSSGSSSQSTEASGSSETVATPTPVPTKAPETIAPVVNNTAAVIPQTRTVQNDNSNEATNNDTEETADAAEETKVEETVAEEPAQSSESSDASETQTVVNEPQIEEPKSVSTPKVVAAVASGAVVVTGGGAFAVVQLAKVGKLGKLAKLLKFLKK